MGKGISRAIHRKGKMLYRFYCRTALTRLLRSRLLAHRITSRRRGNSLAVIETSFDEAAPTEPGLCVRALVYCRAVCTRIHCAPTADVVTYACTDECINPVLR